MSDNDNLTLLEDDIDDGEYDLGHEEEDALLADDFQQEDPTSGSFHQEEADTTSYGYEGQDQDDVLVLNEDLEDLESEMQESQEVHSITMNNSQEGPTSTNDEPDYVQSHLRMQESDTDRRGTPAGRRAMTGRSEDEEEGPEEERGRFKAERTNTGPKRGSHLIPDNLDHVHSSNTGNNSRSHSNKGSWRGRGRGQRGGGFGGRGHSGRPYFQQNGRAPTTRSFLGGGFGPGGPGRGARPPPTNKIHINPHFRGNVQPSPDAARLVWDPDCVPAGVGQQVLPVGRPEQQAYHAYQSPQSSQPQPLLHQQQTFLPQQQHLLHQQQFNHQPQTFYQDSHSSHSVTSMSHPSPWLPPQQPQFPPQQSNVGNMIQQYDTFPPSHAQAAQQYNVNVGYQQHPSYHTQHHLPPGQQQTLYQQQQQQQVHNHAQQFHQQNQTLQHYQPNQRQASAWQEFPPEGLSNNTHPRFQQDTFNDPSQRRFPPPLRQHDGLPKRGGGRGGLFPSRDRTAPRDRPGPTTVANPQRTPPHKRLGSVDVPETFNRSPPKRQKRMPDLTNLHEVKTVDTLLDTTESDVHTLEVEMEEDDELREYRKKIEKQKALRETILQQKEERRKLACLEVQRKLREGQLQEMQDGMAGGDASRPAGPSQGSAIATIVNRNTIAPSLPAAPLRPPVQPRPKGRITTLQNPNLNNPNIDQGSKQSQPSSAVRGSLAQRLGNKVSVNVCTPDGFKNAQGQKQMGSNQLGSVNMVRGGMANTGVMRRGGLVQMGGSVQRGGLLQRGGLVQRGGLMQQGGSVQHGGLALLGSSVQRGGLMQHGGVLKRGRGGRGNTPAPAVGIQRIVTVDGLPQVSQIMQQRQTNHMVMMPSVGQRIVSVSGAQSAPPKRVVVGGVAPTSGGRTISLRTGGNQSSVQRIVMPPQRPGSGRTVITTSSSQQTPPTKCVAIENLAATTSAKHLLKMCRSVGPVEQITMTPSQGRADVTFKNPPAALKFSKTFHRRMVDLSLINVRLI